MAPMPIALAGIGKIARDEHIPALIDSPDWRLDAAISRSASVDGVRNFSDIDEFLADPGEVRTVALALPPGPRMAYARKAIEAGLNVMLEKPPAPTLTELRNLWSLAQSRGVTLYASWHSRMGAAVEETRRRIAEARLRRLRIDWREDVRQSHPGQDWVWEPGNLGVFDPGINAFSILAVILDETPHLTSCRMEIPEGRQMPIAADLDFATVAGAEISGRLDWRHDGDPSWRMEIETDRGTFALTRSGSAVEVDGAEISLDGSVAEYPLVYKRLAELVRASESEFDLRPMTLTADAFLIAERRVGAPFEW